MADFTPTQPVAEHPVPAYVASLARQAIMGLIGWAVGKGIIPPDVSHDLIAAGMALVPVAWGLYTQHANAQKVNAALSAPK